LGTRLEKNLRGIIGEGKAEIRHEPSVAQANREEGGEPHKGGSPDSRPHPPQEEGTKKPRSAGDAEEKKYSSHRKHADSYHTQ